MIAALDVYDEQGTLNVGMDPEIAARRCNFIGLSTTLICRRRSVVVFSRARWYPRELVQRIPGLFDGQTP